MWVEVLAQWAGISFDSTNSNSSYWGHYSPILVEDVAGYSAPADVGTALYVVWVGNADFVWNIYNLSPYDSSNLATWTATNNLWLSNHYTVITNLYAKGARSLVLPNVVDLSQTPTEDWAALTPSHRAFIRARTIEFNAGLSLMVSNALLAMPDLSIWNPDIFSLFDAVLADPGGYGMVNPGVGALFDAGLGDYSLDGPGAHYVFWDDIHPTAKFQMLFAEAAQELIWPVWLQPGANVPGTNLLKLKAVNVPIGRDGVVLASADLVSWTNVLSFESTNSSQTIPVPSSGSSQFYQLEFPFNWVWP